MTEIQKRSGGAPAMQGQEAWDFASTLSRSSLVPEAYRNRPENVFLAIDMAQRLRVGVMEVMQSLFVVHGTPGFSAKYVIAMANQRGPFKGPIHFAYDRSNPQNLRVTAYATVKETDDRVEYTVDMAMAQAEGWTKNPKYKSIPDLMLSYRAATFLVRLYCPEVLLGFQTVEEIEDVRFAESVVVSPTEAAAPLEALAQAGEPAPEVVEATQEEAPADADADAQKFIDIFSSVQEDQA